MSDPEQEEKRRVFNIIKGLNARIELLQTPICIGRPLITILADKGAWVANGGAGAAVVAADELFKANPYDKIDELHISYDRLFAESTAIIEELRAEVEKLRGMRDFLRARAAHCAELINEFENTYKQDAQEESSAST